MGFPQKVLSDDEKVVEQLHPHWITLAPGVSWFLLICVAGGFAIGYAPGHGTTHTVLVWAIVVVGLILLVWLTLRPAIRWLTSHYVFTDHRVLIRTGFLRRDGHDIALRNISDVGFSQSLWERIVGAGTLMIESAGEQGRSVLQDIPHSERQQQMLNRLIEQDAERRAGDGGGHAHPGGTPNQPTEQLPPPPSA
jgi:uncharacterized membrane protein YdbT with pleckstrin-like domain